MSKGKITLNSTQTSNITLVGGGANSGYNVNGLKIVNNGSNAITITGSDQGNIPGVGIIEVRDGHTLNATSEDITIEEISSVNGTISEENIDISGDLDTIGE